MSLLSLLGVNMKTNTLFKFLILPLFLISIISHSSLSLSTNSRWIVSRSGERFKLTCVNWVGHLHVMIPEGLEKQPLKNIAQMVPLMGFNCVRLTWAIQMYTKFANLTVEQSLKTWNLTDATDGIEKNNPDFLKMSISDVQKAVIDTLGENNVVVILDNHVSEPMWCCGDNDGNGFFGDKFFDPGEWLNGLSIVSDKYKGNPTVVGMSLRNELRGRNQNIQQWYNYMQQGAETINKQNPDLLVIVSGLNYDTNLEFLKQKPFNVTCKNKLVFESHWYPFSNSLDTWKHQTNEFCGKATKTFLELSGFLVSSNFPLFLSEFGLDLRGGDEMQNLYLSCLLAHVAGSNIDWALWAFQGSYMLRQNVMNMEEYYGVLDIDWGRVRNTGMLQRLLLIQQVLLDTSRNDPGYYIMFHPQTGLCIQVDDENNIDNSDCRSWAKWSYDQDRQIKSLDGQMCLTAMGDGLPVALSGDCSRDQNTWKVVSGSSLHLATNDKNGNLLCLDFDIQNSSTILTTKCLCIDDAGNDLTRCDVNPQRQWFKLVPANIS